jgi:hypothetical protein
MMPEPTRMDLPRERSWGRLWVFASWSTWWWKSYTYSLYAHTMDWFGSMRVVEILPSDVRELVFDLQAKGMSPATIR